MNKIIFSLLFLILPFFNYAQEKNIEKSLSEKNSE